MTRNIAALTLILATSPAHAVCVALDRIDHFMEIGHGERRVAMGVVGDGQTMMVRYENPETKSWTLVEVDPNKRLACSRISGFEWQAVEAGPKA